MLRLTAIVLSLFALIGLFATTALADDKPFTAKAKVTSKTVVDDTGSFGNLEGRIVKPFVPGDWNVAGGIALQLTTLPDWVPFVSSRKIFADALVSTDEENQTYLGGSISLKPASSDDGLRLGVELFGPDAFETWYLAKAFNFSW